MVEPVTTTALVIKGVCWLCTTLGVSYCAKKAHDAYSKHSKRQKEKLELKGKSLEEARKDNKRAREEERKLKEELERQEEERKKLEQELEQARNKANDPALSEEERAKWRRKIVVLEEQLANVNSNKKSILDTLKTLGERIKNNNKIISGVGLNTDDKHWIWDLVTLENILVVAGIYVAYRILKDEDKK